MSTNHPTEAGSAGYLGWWCQAVGTRSHQNRCSKNVRPHAPPVVHIDFAFKKSISYIKRSNNYENSLVDLWLTDGKHGG